MIGALVTGMLVRLPSGNVVRLLERRGSEWRCEYTPNANARGEVYFTAKFLRDFGVRA